MLGQCGLRPVCSTFRAVVISAVIAEVVAQLAPDHELFAEGRFRCGSILGREQGPNNALCADLAEVEVGAQVAGGSAHRRVVPLRRESSEPGFLEEAAQGLQGTSLSRSAPRDLMHFVIDLQRGENASPVGTCEAVLPRVWVWHGEGG
eukprot:scaffold2626_cov279-Pinguiococcus_pyrenoidosus.AAC.2